MARPTRFERVTFTLTGQRLSYRLKQQFEMVASPRNQTTEPLENSSQASLLLSGAFHAHKHGRRTIVMRDDRIRWVRTLSKVGEQ